MQGTDSPHLESSPTSTDLSYPLLNANTGGAPQPQCIAPARSRWVAFSIVSLFYMFAVLARLATNVISDDLQSDFGLNDEEVASAFASSFFYAVSPPLVGDS